MITTISMAMMKDSLILRSPIGGFRHVSNFHLYLRLAIQFDLHDFRSGSGATIIMPLFVRFEPFLDYTIVTP